MTENRVTPAVSDKTNIKIVWVAIWAYGIPVTAL